MARTKKPKTMTAAGRILKPELIQERSQARESGNPVPELEWQPLSYEEQRLAEADEADNFGGDHNDYEGELWGPWDRLEEPLYNGVSKVLNLPSIEWCADLIKSCRPQMITRCETLPIPKTEDAEPSFPRSDRVEDLVSSQATAEEIKRDSIEHQYEVLRTNAVKSAEDLESEMQAWVERKLSVDLDTSSSPTASPLITQRPGKKITFVDLWDEETPSTSCTNEKSGKKARRTYKDMSASLRSGTSTLSAKLSAQLVKLQELIWSGHAVLGSRILHIALRTIRELQEKTLGLLSMANGPQGRVDEPTLRQRAKLLALVETCWRLSVDTLLNMLNITVVSENSVQSMPHHAISRLVSTGIMAPAVPERLAQRMLKQLQQFAEEHQYLGLNWPCENQFLHELISSHQAIGGGTAITGSCASSSTITEQALSAPTECCSCWTGIPCSSLAKAITSTSPVRMSG